MLGTKVNGVCGLVALGFAASLVAGCTEQGGESLGAAGAVEDAESALSIGSACTYTSLQFADAEELASDLETSIDVKYVSRARPYFPEAIVPGGFRASLPGPVGGMVDTLLGWDISNYDSLDRPAFSMDLPAKQEGLYASIGNTAFIGADTAFGKRNVHMAKVLYEAMTKVKEVRTDHIVSNPSYDQSWIRFRRRSPNGRLRCEKTFLGATTTSGTPSYLCVMSKLDVSRTQSYTVTKDSPCPF